MRDFIFRTFSIIDFISLTIKTITKYAYFQVFQRGYYKILDLVPILLVIFKEWDEKLAVRTLVNIFFNNEQKHTNDSVKKEQVVDFKKRENKE